MSETLLPPDSQSIEDAWMTIPVAKPAAAMFAICKRSLAICSGVGGGGLGNWGTHILMVSRRFPPWRDGRHLLQRHVAPLPTLRGACNNSTAAVEPGARDWT